MKYPRVREQVQKSTKSPLVEECRQTLDAIEGGKEGRDGRPSLHLIFLTAVV